MSFAAIDRSVKAIPMPSVYDSSVLSSVVGEVTMRHPVEEIERNICRTERNSHINKLQTLYGSGSVLRYQMEEAILSQFHGGLGIVGLGVGSRDGAYSGLNTLRGADAKLDLGDIIGLPENREDFVDIHSSMERRLNL